MCKLFPWAIVHAFKLLCKTEESGGISLTKRFARSERISAIRSQRANLLCWDTQFWVALQGTETHNQILIRIHIFFKKTSHLFRKGVYRKVWYGRTCNLYGTWYLKSELEINMIFWMRCIWINVNTKHMRLIDEKHISQKEGRKWEWDSYNNKHRKEKHPCEKHARQLQKNYRNERSKIMIYCTIWIALSGLAMLSEIAMGLIMPTGDRDVPVNYMILWMTFYECLEMGTLAYLYSQKTVGKLDLLLTVIWSTV